MIISFTDFSGLKFFKKSKDVGSYELYAGEAGPQV